MRKSNWTHRVIFYWVLFTFLSAALMLSLTNINYELTISPRYHFPAIIYYSDSNPNDESLYGISVGPIVKVYKSHLDYPNKNFAMIPHELIHVEQWYETFGISSYLAGFSEKYRAYIECEAYAYQLLFTPFNPKIGHKGNIDYITDMLVKDYEIEKYSKAHMTAMINVFYEDFCNVSNDGS